MGDGGGRVALAPRLAWAIPVSFLCLLLPTRAGVAVDYGNGAAGAAVAVALFVLPLLYAVPRGRVVWDRHRNWLLAAQAVLTYLPFLVFGQTWVVGLSGLLGGLLLLTVRAPVSWLLLGLIVAVEGVLRIGLLGVYPTPGVQYITWVFAVPVDMALPLFGLVRLADLVTQLRAARTDLAALAVTAERLQATARLRAAIGDRLEVVTARAKAAVAVLPHTPEQARAHLTEAAGIARQALKQIRETVAGDQPDPGRPAPQPQHPGGTLAPRLARLVLVMVLGVFSVHHLAILADAPAGGLATAAGAAAIVAISALQLYHSLAGREGSRPRVWGLTLAVQTLLPFTLFGAADLGTRFALLGMIGFPAGSVLLLLAGWWAWPVSAAVAASMGVLWALESPGELDGAVYLVGLAASTGLAVYGLSRLTGLAEDLTATGRKLARAAVDQERLRVARDTHDLLGLGLSAVALKCDLAARLLGRDDARARGELEALVRLAAQARADVLAVTADERHLSLRVELAAAAEVLDSAGIAADVRAEPLGGRLPEEVDAVLATVLREAVTNVLGHAKAARCEIELTTGEGDVRLRVTNDGVTNEPTDQARSQEPQRRPGGRGLANLAGRAAALGGRLTTHAQRGHFELTVRVPLPAEASARPRGEDALAAGDPAHGVDKVIDRTVLDQEP